MTNIRFTNFTKDNGIITKCITLDKGKIKKSNSTCWLSRGTAETVSTPFSSLGAYLDNLDKTKVVSWGVSKHNKVNIVKQSDEAKHPDAISRTGKHFRFPKGEYGVFMIDNDDGLSHDKLWSLINSVIPEFEGVARIERPSCSSGIYLGNKLLTTQNSGRIYVLVDDASQIPRIGECLHNRLILANHGHVFTTKSGSMLVRSAVDNCVWQPERLDFVAPPKLGNNLTRRAPKSEYFDGPALVTANIESLTNEEQTQLDAIIKKLKDIEKPNANKVKAKYIRDEAHKLVKKCNISESDAIEIVQQRTSGNLADNDILCFDDLGDVTVAEVLRNLEKYDEKTLADPLEFDYGGGRCKAKFYANIDTGPPIINSFAHGSRIYKLGKAEKNNLTRGELIQKIEATDDFNELTGEIAELVTKSNLKPSEITFIRKMIAKKTNTSVKVLEEDAKRLSNVDTELGVAMETIKYYDDNNLIFSSDSFWRYKKGLWSKVTDRLFKTKIHKVLKQSEMETTKGLVNSTLDLAKTEALRENHQFNIGSQYMINCLNCEIHFDSKGLPIDKDHNRENFMISQIPISYDKNAQAPRFEQFLEEIFIDDPDKNEKKQLLLEMVGYTLTTNCDYEKFILLLGAGANGKSVFLSVLQNLLGPNSVCSVKPDNLNNKHQRAHLHTKLANIVTEIPEGAVIADAELKSLTSGELTTAEHKYKDPFDFIPYATFWFATNHMPHTRDFSEALFRRPFIIKFNRVFTELEQDKRLNTKLMKELPGILNLAVNAFALVLKNNEFTMVPSSEKAKHEWRLEADQAAQFATECCCLETTAKTLSEDIYTSYRCWAEQAGIKKTLNHKNLTRRLERLGVKQGRGAKGVRMLLGIKSKT